ncbi:MAG: A/G-specific adenine glycosylase [Bacteroidota bacterium]
MLSWNRAAIEDFREQLLNWGQQIDRPMPWKGIKNPYFIWLSEIILQQTRVEQGLPYFERFVNRFPTVDDLAEASEDEVLKLWEGLGYYSRARNLHFTAKYISTELSGVFPNTHKEISKLKGVGPYTAAAIASFAFDLPFAVVDGNVYRVLSRILGIDLPIDSTLGKKAFAQIAQELLPNDRAAAYNQAMMDFGALQCVPKSPSCPKCPFQDQCQAHLTQSVKKFPVKAKKLKKRDRYFHYLVFEADGNTLIQQRRKKDVWQQLYEFPLIELKTLDIEREELLHATHQLSDLGAFTHSTIEKSRPFRQTLSHQNIHALFWKITLQDILPKHSNQLISIEQENLTKFAFPKIIDWYLNDKSLYLNL